VRARQIEQAAGGHELILGNIGVIELGPQLAEIADIEPAAQVEVVTRGLGLAALT